MTESDFVVDLSNKEPSVRKLIHYTIWVHNKPRYLCNQAVKGTITKMTVDPSAVTCKNCLRLKKVKP